MNTQGYITNTEKVRLLETEGWKILPSVWILKLLKGGRKYINIWSNVDEIQMFSCLTTSPQKFGDQESISIHFEYIYPIQIYGSLMICDSETQIS